MCPEQGHPNRNTPPRNKASRHCTGKQLSTGAHRDMIIIIINSVVITRVMGACSSDSLGASNGHESMPTDRPTDRPDETRPDRPTRPRPKPPPPRAHRHCTDKWRGPWDAPFFFGDRSRGEEHRGTRRPPRSPNRPLIVDSWNKCKQSAKTPKISAALRQLYSSHTAIKTKTDQTETHPNRHRPDRRHITAFTDPLILCRELLPSGSPRGGGSASLPPTVSNR